MARAPDGIRARTELVHVRLDRTELRQLDRKRGSTTRSEFIRRAIREKPGRHVEVLDNDSEDIE